jgi:predicted metal-dependent phosphoesterase TrpH
MPRIDLHTHSVASPDGAIQATQYKHLLTSGRVDMVAVTDHNRIDFAQELQAELGDTVIVGEEITTPEGEIIGLFLKELVEPGQTPLETVKAIKAQGGLVYIPHPFETARKGLQTASLNAIADYIDIVEVHNGRAFLQKRSDRAALWAHAHGKISAASSDAHGAKGVGHTYTVIAKLPTQASFLQTIESGQMVAARPPFTTYAYPKFNRLHKKLRRQK